MTALSKGHTADVGAARACYILSLETIILTLTQLLECIQTYLTVESVKLLLARNGEV